MFTKLKDYTIIRLFLFLFLFVGVGVGVAHATKVIGNGMVSLENITGSVLSGSQANDFHLKGSVNISLSAGSNDVVPDGIYYASLYIYGQGFQDVPFCGVTDAASLCSFPINPGDKLSTVIQLFPTTFELPAAYHIASATGLAGICGGVVLSPTKRANEAQWSIGPVVCGGVRPPDTSCTVTPNDLSMSVTMNSNSSASADVTGTISCNSAATVKLITSTLPDSQMILGGSNGPKVNLKINDIPSSDGADISVNRSSTFKITADVVSGSQGGEFSGSTPLIVAYH